MSKVKTFQLMMTAIIIMVILILLPFIGLTDLKDADKQKSLDVITIELPEETIKNEMPAVNFLHTLHNKAVDGKCAECHTQKDDTFVFKFKRTDEKASMALYHDNCISCHIETKKRDKKAGPLAAECRSCHGIDKKAEPSFAKIDFDKSLHFIHETSKDIKPLISSQSDNCSACHHKYNTETKQTYYVKGEEESCTYCHQNKKIDDTRSIKDASHDSCVACHTGLKNKDTKNNDIKNKDIKAGPITCKGCHDLEEQSKIKARLAKIEKDIPRLKRNQPDETVITGLITSLIAEKISEGESSEYLMNGVAFNHKLHEAKTKDCTSCHHKSLKKCNDCHTAKGSVEGKFFSLEHVMHDKKSQRSCVGCHAEFTKQSDCAGCHAMMPKQMPKDRSCAACHNTKADMIPLDSDAQKVLAAKVVEKQSDDYQIIMDDKIPEKVIIGELANEYKPSEFPHRKVVKAIAKRVEKSSMAKVFHENQQTLCMGCHHNSPKSIEPPKCVSCHGKKSNIINGKPHLKGAYHRQCITCHQKMDVKQVLPTDCNKCHEPNKTAN
ncbi:MAG: cytochrome c3 family protein [Desulfobacteraceae bacterium]|nr:cytochrome c3 family protein [Desulfobacteraceae bacterium]